MHGNLHIQQKQSLLYKLRFLNDLKHPGANYQASKSKTLFSLKVLLEPLQPLMSRLLTTLSNSHFLNLKKKKIACHLQNPKRKMIRIRFSTVKVRPSTLKEGNLVESS